MTNHIEKAPADLARGSERNYGIDLLRIVAMLYVVILHCIGPGGILEGAAVGSLQYKVAWLLEIWTYGAVNIFALISGYVSYTAHERRTGWTNYILLWLQVVFYGVVVTLAFNCFRPDLVTKKDLFQTLFPVTNGLYWYLSAYTGLFVLMPLLNAGLRKCPEKTLKKVFVVIFAVFSVYDMLTFRMNLESGYSVIWVTLLYIMGAIVKKCGIGSKLSIGRAVVGMVLLCLLAWLWKMGGLQFSVGGVAVSRDMLVSYVSPAVLGGAVLHVVAFSKLRIGGWMKKVVAFAAPAAFAVYILNCHGIVWAHMIYWKFISWAACPAYELVIRVLAFSLAFLVAGILIDRVRIWIFDRLRV